MTLQKFTISELNENPRSKGELFQSLRDAKLEFDYALPQYWLDCFAKYCEKLNPIITYHLILSTMVWYYGDCKIGRPMTMCTDVQIMLDKFNREG